MENELTPLMQARQRIAVIRRILSTNPAPGEMELLVNLETQFIRMMPNDDTTCRYYADTTGWRVDMMDGGRSPPLRGELGEYPDWLAVILDVARIGGHITHWPGSDGRPTHTVWFRVGSNNQLTEFVDIPK